MLSNSHSTELAYRMAALCNDSVKRFAWAVTKRPLHGVFKRGESLGPISAAEIISKTCR